MKFHLKIKYIRTEEMSIGLDFSIKFLKIIIQTCFERFARM